MAQYVIPFTVTIPPDTLASAPYVEDLQFDNWTITQIDLEVPAGPSGLMGFQIWNNGVPWIPFGPGQWLVWDNTKESYYMTDQPNSSGWAVAGYNTGFYQHSVTVRFHVNAVIVAAQAPATPALVIVTSSPPVSDPVTL